MTSRLLLGLDLGTQAVKGVLVDLKGRVVSEARHNRQPRHPQPHWAEMDPERDWWLASVHVIRELLSKANPSQSIEGIGVTALASCLCPLDSEGRPLRAAILYSDNRAVAELEWVNRQLGTKLSAEAVVPKLLWLKHHEPQVFERTAVSLTANGYVIYKLTRILSMDYDNASIMGGVFDPHRLVWDQEALRAVGLPPSIFPQPFPATAVVGKVTKEAAEMTGLPSGIPVIAGTGDTFPTIVGCGAIHPGDAMISYGTTGLLTLTARPLVEVVAGPHFQDDVSGGAVRWGANVLTAGRLAQWFRDQFAQAELSVAQRLKCSEFVLLEGEAKEIPPGANGLIALPHFSGRRTPTPNPYLRGAILGLTPAHTPAHVYRSLLESFAFNIRQGYEPLREQIRRLIATGGGASSELWRQIMADVLNTQLIYYPKASGALGIAYLCGYALGLIPDFETIQHEWLAEASLTQPDPQQVGLYQRLFEYYCRLDRTLEGFFTQIGQEPHGITC
ncbi:MAG: FGGY family carbohydrate kinase [Anaerolineales bacterium]|nr:FGGY family carbohydrate kinase [Anaerolineales bacterium]MCS7248150.1 FGGY family carbohydrate kinase [Anaerolineales bacterium]MDW8161962.1 FGGY family carbohydrate kinase [Anaerolineales bacterium]MDW8447175.1 FGGY family carbohydrate kinase [Anaerolineales bacterium]